MRDVLLVSIFAAGALMALRRPWIGVMLWTWISVMNPHRFTWGFAYNAPLAAIAAAVTLLGILTTTEERRWPFSGTPPILLLLLAGWITVTFFFSQHIQEDFPIWERVMKIYLMTFVVLVLLHNKHHIMAFIWVTAGSLAFLGVKGGVFTLLTGGAYRVWGPAGSFIEDNNDLALALVITIPLLHFLQLQVSRAWVRHALTATMLLCAVSAIGSHSRGGLLAIAAMGVVLWWRSPRKIFSAALIALVVLAFLPTMPEGWWDRMRTIEHYDQDGSAQGRLYAWRVAWEVATHHFFGAGMSYQHPIFFALYGTGGDNVVAAHSIYFQILGNHGFVGLGLFVSLWIATVRWAGWLRRNAATIPQARWAADLGSMVQVSLVGYAVGGAFLSLSYFDLPYDVMLMVVLARKWVESRGWERDPQEPFLVYAGVWPRRARRNAHPTAAGDAAGESAKRPAS